MSLIYPEGDNLELENHDQARLGHHQLGKKAESDGIDSLLRLPL